MGLYVFDNYKYNELGLITDIQLISYKKQTTMSDEFSMDEAALEEVTEEVSETRPMFLTVLCILTWIGSGIGVLSGLFSVLTYSRATQKIKESGVKFQDLSDELDSTPSSGEAGEEIAKKMMKGVVEGMDSMIEWANTINWINIGVATMCIIGAVLMWKLKRTGFFLYTVATIIGVVTPITLMGSNFLTLMSVAVGGFFGLIFIILYGVNYKHLK
jgi:hypothetical protein